MEKPINQRLKFLLETFNLSARDFSRAVGVPDNNTQNYLEPRFAQPKAEYLEKVMLHFESINPKWLLTGQGEPFVPGTEPEQNVSIKKSKGPTIGINHGTANQNTSSASDSEKELNYLRDQVDTLRSQLQDKERIIQLLEMQLKK